ncbi:MAG: hypothetical protein JW900_04685 [Anaerolineae bacterium]|nr:hypothetical protein [Anaerolineae bacterium]
MKERTQRVLLAIVLLLLAVLACNVPRDGATPSPVVITGEPDGPVTATFTPTEESPEDGDGPPETEEPGCIYEADFVTDVTVPDNTQFEGGDAFVKTWRLRNSGQCSWETGTRLVFLSGDQLDGPDTVLVGPVEPGATVDVSVNLAAPDAPGNYRGDWRLETPDGLQFGPNIYVRIVVAAATVVPPSPVPTPLVPPVVAPFDGAWEAVGGMGGPLGYPTGEAVLDWWEADQLFERGLMYWQDTGGYPANYVYVLYYGAGTDPTAGSWERYEDTWVEGMEEYTCPAATPPNGPKRGFGKVWCDHPSVRNDLGNAIEPEAGFYGGFQNFEGGRMLWSSRLDAVYVLFNDGSWERVEVAP